MRQQSHGFPVNGLNERIIFRESECGQRAGNPLTPAGLLAPTYRNQLAFIDIFFRGMNNTNYNMAVCGTSGAGKTGLIQPLIRSVLDSGGFAVVFDMGDGYKSLCENMGGVYLDGETLRFNPFANITDIDQSAERVRDQLAGLVMTVLTVGLVSCAGKSLPRFWPGDFFPTFYACHLAVLGVLAL